MSSHLQVLSCPLYMKKRRTKMAFSMSLTVERIHSGIRSRCSLLSRLELFLALFTTSDFVTVFITARQ
uniref:Autophagy-related protein n=1 Tax=Rhizophora mucronata TaxID=61149 RepID=A0A2P2KBF2_RHIMU